MIEKLDTKMECVEITLLGRLTECLGFDSAKAIGYKINELVDAVNKLQATLDAYTKRFRELDDESMLKITKITQNSTNNVKNSHLFQGNEHIADVSKKIKRAADSANKNLDNALEVAVQSMKNIKAFYEESYADPHTFVNWHTVAQRLANEASDALTQIAIILKVRQKD